MPRQTIYLESAINPQGNVKLLADELEKAFETATDGKTRPDGLRLEMLHLNLSSWVGQIAVMVFKTWTKQDFEKQDLVILLREIIVYSLVAIEALNGREA